MLSQSNIKKTANTMHIVLRVLVVRHPWILASHFSPRGHERSPKSVPTTCTNR
jgi:hypothetical protein